MKRIESCIDSFPPLPACVAEVIEVTNNPEASANELLRVISRDQSICTAVLKIANSSLFGRPKEVKSLENAIMVLGFSEVRNIVLGQAVVSSFSGVVKQHKAEVNAFWDHSFTTGLAAKIIGEHFGQSAGLYFITGLLHDIGKLAMLLTFTSEYLPEEWMVNFSDKKLLADEKKTFSLSHDDVGAYLLEKWQFPDDIVTALKYHHSPIDAGKHTVFAQIIELSDILAYFCCHPEVETGDDLVETITTYLPGFESRWQKIQIPWQPLVIESWLAWVKIDREHGNSTMTMLSY